MKSYNLNREQDKSFISDYENCMPDCKPADIFDFIPDYHICRSLTSCYTYGDPYIFCWSEEVQRYVF